jgi:hypothetical protein
MTMTRRATRTSQIKKVECEEEDMKDMDIPTASDLEDDEEQEELQEPCRPKTMTTQLISSSSSSLDSSLRKPLRNVTKCVLCKTRTARKGNYHNSVTNKNLTVNMWMID